MDNLTPSESTPGSDLHPTERWMHPIYKTLLNLFVIPKNGLSHPG